jgi:hypothetical protein
LLRRSRRFKRTRKGIEVALPDAERELLAGLVPQLRELLLGDADPNLRRLFPTAYPTDPKQEDEFRSLVHDSLLEGRLAALDTLEATVRERTLTDDQLGCWMGSINDLRLVLGTRLDVSEDELEIDAMHPEAGAHAVYHYLGWVLDDIVKVMTETLPAPTQE